MMQCLRGHPARLTVAMAALACWPAMPAATPAGQQLDEQSLYVRARNIVLRLEVDRHDVPGSPEQPSGARGSAVIVELESPPGKPRVATLVTAYHVLYQAKSGRVFAGAQQVATIGGATPCFLDRSRELAMLRVELTAGVGNDLAKAELDPPAAVDEPADGKPVEGMAFGYSLRRSSALDYSRIDFHDLVSAETLKLVPSGRTLRDGERAPEEMLFRLLGNQATLEGMSGGLVLAADKRFAGIVFGRRTDQFNLVIPAPAVAAVRATAKAATWPRLGDNRQRDPGLFGSGDGCGAPVEDRLDWGTQEGLAVLLGDDPLRAIERFQEVLVTPPLCGPQRNLEIYVHRTETFPTRDHRLVVFVDGDERKIDPQTGKVTLRLAELRGETMVTLFKESGKVNDFELGKLFRPSRIDVSFQYEGGRPFLRVVRSLPTIVQAYPLFVTVVNDWDARPRNAPGRPPANARLALRLDFAEAVLNHAPFDVELKNGAQEYGFFRVNKDGGWALRRLSPQRLGLTLNGRLHLPGEIRYRDVALKMPPGDPPPFNVSGRFQFPYEMPAGQPFLSPRATATDGRGEVRLPVGDNLTFDVAGVLRHLFTCEVNRRLIGDVRPHAFAYEKLVPFLARLGVGVPDGWTAKLHQARFVRGHRDEVGKDWLILTFRLDPDKSAAPAAPADKQAPDEKTLLAPPDEAGPPGRVLEVRAWGVPGSVLAKFPGLRADDPLVGTALKSARVDDLTLTVDLPGSKENWFDGLPPLDPAKPLSLLRNNANEVAERILVALKHSIGRAENVSLCARVGAGFVPEVVKAALNQPGLNALTTEGRAALTLQARLVGAGPSVTVLLSDGPLVLAAPAGQAVNLGNGASATGLRLSVSKLTITGLPGTAPVKAEVEAELGFGALLAGGERYEAGKGRVTLKLDSAPQNAGLGNGAVLRPSSVRQTRLGPIELKLDGKIDFAIDRSGKVTFDWSKPTPIGPP